MPRRELGVEVLRYFCSPPLSKKRSSARSQEKKQKDPSVPFTKTRDAREDFVLRGNSYPPGKN